MPSELTSQDVAEIVRESDLRSGPVRRNFTALKNKLNEAIRALAAAAIGTTNAETTAARPYHTSIGDRLDSMWKGQANYVKYGGVVSINGGDAQKIDVTAGEAKVDGADVKWNAATSGTISYTISNTRYDVVVANSDSTISIVTGTAHATPKFPALATSQKALAVLLVTTSAVSIFYQMASVMDRDLFDGNHYNTTPVTTYGLKRKEIFTSNGTWTRPIGIQKVHITCVGAGGSGGDGPGADAGQAAGGGGGSGQIIEIDTPVSADISIVVGNTGNTSFGTIVAYAGKDGGNPTFTGGNLSTAGDGGAGADEKGLNGYEKSGGTGGSYLSVSPFTAVYPTAGGYGAGGGGGVGGAGYDGADGGPSIYFMGGSKGSAAGSSMGGGGGGGGGYNGPGADGGDGISGDGNSASYYGAGGGGGAALLSSGGAGGPGICIVEWEE